MQKPENKGTGSRNAELARLPGVSRLLARPAIEPLLRAGGTDLVTDLLREHLDELRRAILDDGLTGPALDAAVADAGIARQVGVRIEAILGPRPRPVINATGVVVHTNLGRSTLSEAAARQLASAARGYLDLEYDLDSAGRGNRMAHLTPLMDRLFPGYGFTVVNNNAAAILLCLRALGADREVLVSRGELVEIGGSFRVPDILAASGARLHEVGTTNRTRLDDYRGAIDPSTGLILKVHTSNFRIVGFTHETGVDELSALARETGLPLVVDWGSGSLIDLAPLDLGDEIPVRRILADGANLVTFSGDKLLGGPQSGFVVGDRDLIERVRRDPLARVCRLDRLLLGALHRTLAAYVRGTAFDDVPTLRMLALDRDALDRRAREVLDAVTARTGCAEGLDVIDGISRTGGGSSPTGERPTRLVAVGPPAAGAATLERALRGGTPPIIARVREGRLLIDLRTVLPEQQGALIDRLSELLGRGK